MDTDDSPSKIPIHNLWSSYGIEQYEHDKCTNRIFLWLYSASVIYVCCIWCSTALIYSKARTHIKLIDPCAFSVKENHATVFVGQSFFPFEMIYECKNWKRNTSLKFNRCSFIHSHLFHLLLHLSLLHRSPHTYFMRVCVLIGRASSHNLNWRCLKPIITWFGLPIYDSFFHHNFISFQF